MTHPDRDCEDCGTYHSRWSEQQADARRRKDHLAPALVLMAELQTVLDGWTGEPETAAEVLEALAGRFRPGL